MSQSPTPRAPDFVDDRRHAVTTTGTPTCRSPPRRSSATRPTCPSPWTGGTPLPGLGHQPADHAPRTHTSWSKPATGPEGRGSQPDFADHTKFADDAPAAPGTDGALAMAMGRDLDRVPDRQVPYRLRRSTPTCRSVTFGRRGTVTGSHRGRLRRRRRPGRGCGAQDRAADPRRRPHVPNGSTRLPVDTVWSGR
jgi:hypothetical protein